jgi:hypothetical protein
MLDFVLGFATTGFPVSGSVRVNPLGRVVWALAVETVPPAMIAAVARSMRIFMVRHHPGNQTDTSFGEAGALRDRLRRSLR